MPNRSLKVVIIGAGIGGLTLAQGLRRAGLNVAIYERDAALDSRGQGYRIHLDSGGASGLFSCLPPPLYRLIVETSGRPSSQITTVSWRLTELQVVRFPELPPLPLPIGFSAPIDRLTVRQILLAGLGSTMHWGKEFNSFAQLENGQVRAHFADGTSADADLLIGADGTGSRVRQQLVPHASLRDTGECCIFGKTPLNETTQPFIPPFLQNGFTAVIGKQRCGMALGLMEFTQRPDIATAKLAPRQRLRPVDDYIMWALAFPRDQLSRSAEALATRSGSDLLRTVESLTDEWHPSIRAFVTLLGDAIHTMRPSGGSGANVALRDAATLYQHLVSVQRNNTSLLQALHDYEVAMLEYSFVAVRESERANRWLPNPFALPAKLAHRLRRIVRRVPAPHR